MSRKNKNIPVPDPNQDRLEYTCPSASWGDMTGLIPYAANSDSELNSYEDVYPFLPGNQPDNADLPF